MDDTIDFGVLLEDLVEGLLVRDVDLVELWSLAGDELNAVESHLGRVVEVIDNHHLVAILKQGKRGERADVASTTANPQSIIEYPLMSGTSTQ